MFNEHQEAYMDMLAKLPAEQKCYCGWYKVGQCQNGCDPTKTNADKIKHREAATPSPAPDTCPHKMLKRQNVGNRRWYRCPECQQKFIASDWDGKVKVGAPSPAVSQPPQEERMYVCLRCGAESWRIPSQKLTRCENGECSGQIVTNPRRG